MIGMDNQDHFEILEQDLKRTADMYMPIQSIWYHQDFLRVGIVQVVTLDEKEKYRQTGKANFKYFIGVGSNKNEKTDEQEVIAYGKLFDVSAGNILFRVD